MRCKRIIELMSMFAVFSLTLVGCLKDKDYENGLIQTDSNAAGSSQNLVEIQLTASNATNFYHTSFDNSNNDTTIDLVPVVISSPDLPKTDVHVTLTLNPALVDAYNTANGTAYQVPSASMYIIANSGTVTIPAGTRRAFLQVMLKPSDFLGADWALGFTISSADNGYAPSGNLSDGVVAISVKNTYDGDYTANGYFYHPAAPRAIVDLAINLATVNATTSLTTLGDLSNLIYLTVDATNHVTIADAGPSPGIAPTAQLASLPAGYTPFAGSDPSIYNNTYDPSTRTFYLRYGYQGASGYRVVEEVLTHN